MSTGPSQTPARATVLVTGRVQGVFFRASAMETAQRLGVTGWIKNLPDGGVESVVEGPRHAVDAFVRWCEAGPAGARVEGVEVSWAAPRDEFDTFRVLR